MIIKSLLDTDWYKFLMLQFIWKHARDVDVSFQTKNRTTDVKLADAFSAAQLYAELLDVQSLRLTYGEIKFLEQTGAFEDDFIVFLIEDFKLSSFEITTEDDQHIVTFNGKWVATTMWEIYAVTIMNELRNKSFMQNQKDPDRSRCYDEAYRDNFTTVAEAEALVGAMTKLDSFRAAGVKFTDFGTRRRYSTKFQFQLCETTYLLYPDVFAGTSNVAISHYLGTKPVGTNAHELPMVWAALAKTSEELKMSQYEVLKLWGEMYPDYKVMLPDTYGTIQFLKDAPLELLEEWKGIRVDSMNPYQAGDIIIETYKQRGIDPMSKTIIFSDGLDEFDIINLFDEFRNKINVAFGWGTNFTFDFKHAGLKPISLVCKVKEVNGRSAVKLSDNTAKAMGAPDQIKRYLEVFQTEQETRKVVV